jgi:hypothetical protein
LRQQSRRSARAVTLMGQQIKPLEGAPDVSGRV